MDLLDPDDPWTNSGNAASVYHTDTLAKMACILDDDGVFTTNFGTQPGTTMPPVEWMLDDRYVRPGGVHVCGSCVSPVCLNSGEFVC